MDIKIILTKINGLLHFFILSSPVPHFILFLTLILIAVAGLFLYIFLRSSSNQKKQLLQELSSLKEKTANQEQELSNLKAAKNKLLQEIEDNHKDPSSMSANEYEHIFAQNKELIFLSKDFLVNDFIEIIKQHYPQTFNLKQQKIKIPLPIQNRIKTILLQLEKVETLASVYHFKFSIDYYYQKVYYFLGNLEFYKAVEELRAGLSLFNREDNFYIYLSQLLSMMGRYEQSNTILLEFLDYRVGHVPSYELLIFNFIQLKKYSEAEQTCLKLLELKNTPQYQSLLAYIYLLEGFISKAEHRYEEITGMSDFPALTYYYLGKIDESQGHYREALAKYLKVYNMRIRDYSVLKDIVRLNTMLTHLSHSKKIIEEIQYNPDIDAEIFYEYIQNYNKKHKKVLFFLDILLELHKQRKIDYRLLNTIGSFYLLLHKKAEALEYFQLSHSENKQYLPTIVNLIKWHLTAGKFSEAKAYLDAGFEFYPHNSELSLLLSEYYYKQKDFEGSKSVLNEVLEREPSNIMLYNKIGLVYLKEKNYKEALVWLHKLEEYDIKNVELYRNLGFAYLRLENYTDAVSYYTKVLQLDAANIDAYNNLGVIFSIKKEFKKAKKYLNKALQIDPNSKETNYNLALLYEKINKENSIKYYSKYKDLIKEENSADESKT